MTMRIVCLGWGSLIWDPSELPIEGEWHSDGPFLPVEFARQSRDDRITLVLVPGRKAVPTLWADMSITDLDEAIKALQAREGTSTANIGVWHRRSKQEEAPTGKNDTVQAVIASWAQKREIDAAIWTNLPPKFDETNDHVPTANEVVAHLQRLEGDARKKAEEYVRRAPKQIRTDYRQVIEDKLGWTP
jgi:hypothetical protein